VKISVPRSQCLLKIIEDCVVLKNILTQVFIIIRYRIHYYVCRYYQERKLVVERIILFFRVEYIFVLSK